MGLHTAKGKKARRKDGPPPQKKKTQKKTGKLEKEKKKLWYVLIEGFKILRIPSDFDFVKMSF